MRPLRRLYRYTLRLGAGMLVIGTLIELISRSQVSLLLILFTLMLPAFGVVLLAVMLLGMAAWQVPIALAGSAVIVHERAESTWDILLTTPIPHTSILLSKLAVGLTRLQSFITLAALLQIIPLIGLLGQINRPAAELSGFSPLVLTLIVTALFVIDRLQQFVLAGLLGLAASLLADTWPLAVAGSVALGGILWMLRSAVALALAAAVNNIQWLDVNQVAVIGVPIVAAAARYPVAGMLLLALLLLVQEGVVRALLAWLLRRMITAR